jgi:hypothetical protein
MLKEDVINKINEIVITEKLCIKTIGFIKQIAEKKRN